MACHYTKTAFVSAKTRAHITFKRLYTVTSKLLGKAPTISTACLQFSSVQDGIYALEKPICTPPRLSEVSPNVAFEMVPMFV